MRPNEAPGDSLRIACELPDNLSVCRLRAKVRAHLVSINIPIDRSWRNQTEADRVKCVEAIMERFGPVYPRWATNIGIVRKLLMVTLRDHQRTTRLKGRGYKCANHIAYRAPRISKGYYKGDTLKLLEETYDRSAEQRRVEKANVQESPAEQRRVEKARVQESPATRRRVEKANLGSSTGKIRP